MVKQFKISVIIPGLVRLGILLFALTPIFSKGQNLVKNPSFEDTNDSLSPFLYVYTDSFPTTKEWFTPLNNRTTWVTSYSFENYNGNLNQIYPRSGSACGLVCAGSSWTLPGFNLAKTFLQTRLKEPLEANCPYYSGLYYIFRWKAFTGDPAYDTSHFAANRLGMHFDSIRIRDLIDTDNFGNPQVFAFDNQGIVPQIAIPTSSFYNDTINYALLADTLIAQGGEEYLTIGNFYPMNQTFARSFRTGLVTVGTSTSPANLWNSGAFVDDVFVIPLPPPDTMLQSSNDSIICRGDTISLSASSPNPDYTFLWDNGDTSSNREISQAGTYWVRLLCGCSTSITDTFHIREVPPNNWQAAWNDTLLCPQDTFMVNLDPQLNYHLNSSVWNKPYLEISQAGSYFLEWTNGCESSTHAFRVDYRSESNFPNLNLDSTICAVPDYRLNLDSLQNRFTIKLNDRIFSEELSLNEHGDYSLKLIQLCDSFTYQFSINQENCSPDFIIPDAFSPNGDGLNDYFQFGLPGIVNRYELKIFNRWGQLVFSSNEPNLFWDGSFKGAVHSGSYTYTLTVNLNGIDIKRKGIVRVIL